VQQMTTMVSYKDRWHACVISTGTSNSQDSVWFGAALCV